MEEDVKTIYFKTVDNQIKYNNFHLEIDFNRIKIVKDLKYRIALRFYRDPEYIIL
jgi:hypothetical protein